MQCQSIGTRSPDLKELEVGCMRVKAVQGISACVQDLEEPEAECIRVNQSWHNSCHQLTYPSHRR